MKPGEEKVWLNEFPATPTSVTPGATTPCLLTNGNGNSDVNDDGDGRCSVNSNNNHHKTNSNSSSPLRRSPLQVRFVDETDTETQLDDCSATQPILLQIPTSRMSTPVKKFSSPKF